MQPFKISRAQMKDLPRILQIYECARKFMKETGNANQWKDHFPPEDLLLDDLRAGQLYVVRAENQIHAVFALILGPDPTYTRITDGAWLSDAEYGTLHRIAADGSAHGMFDQIVSFCEQKISHLRVDTHADNKIMQHLIRKNGFQRCGVIYVADGSPRIAYEKV